MTTHFEYRLDPEGYAVVDFPEVAPPPAETTPEATAFGVYDKGGRNTECVTVFFSKTTTLGELRKEFASKMGTSTLPKMIIKRTGLVLGVDTANVFDSGVSDGTMIELG